MKIEKEYKELLITIKQKVREAQLKAIISANSQMLLLYYQLGNYILESQHKQGWGAKIIDRLPTDLKKEFFNFATPCCEITGGIIPTMYYCQNKLGSPYNFN